MMLLKDALCLTKRSKNDHVMFTSNEIRVEPYLVKRPGRLMLKWMKSAGQRFFQNTNMGPVMPRHSISIYMSPRAKWSRMESSKSWKICSKNISHTSLGLVIL